MTKTDPDPITRRHFLQQTAAATAVVGLGSAVGVPTWAFTSAPAEAEELFKISLSQWSFHRAIFGDARRDYEWFIKTLHSDPDAVLQGPLDPRDIVVKAREHGIDAVDYVNVLFYGHADDRPYLADLMNRAGSEGVKNLMIMCDETGRLGAADPAKRMESVEAHVRWLEAAAFLGCHSIRVNAVGDGSYLEQMQRTAEGLAALCERAAAMDLNVLVENHGESSNNGAWLAMVIESVGHPRLHALADFDNFFMGGWNVDPPRWYDRYQGLMDLAPYTHSVSAKAHGFDDDGQEIRTDFAKALRILIEGGFNGYASVEYEGDGMTEDEGVAATKRLLLSLREQLAEELGRE